MSHTLKLFLKIIHKRVYKKVEEGIGPFQFGFRSGFGIREALFAFNLLLQRSLEVGRDVFVCFMDYEEGFATVQHKK